MSNIIYKEMSEYTHTPGLYLSTLYKFPHQEILRSDHTFLTIISRDLVKVCLACINI